MGTRKILLSALCILTLVSRALGSESQAEFDVICPELVVSKAGYAHCNGKYSIVDLKVEWAPSRPVYKLGNRNRYIFWNKQVAGWSIGNKNALTTGVVYHHSGLDTKEPWQGVWKGEYQVEGVQVECKAVCSESEFDCGDGKGADSCIERSMICDGYKDCYRDGRDELDENCGHCTTSEFACADGLMCIPRYDLCDGWAQCTYGSDELEEYCGHCKSSEFACADGKQCVPASWTCDQGVNGHCKDMSDEDPSICGDCTTSEFACVDGSLCISKYGLCDGLKDCDDESDEWAENCGNCKSPDFACADGLQCIPASKKCDGITYGCKDGSDEHPSICGEE